MPRRPAPFGSAVTCEPRKVRSLARPPNRRMRQAGSHLRGLSGCRVRRAECELRTRIYGLSVAMSRASPALMHTWRRRTREFKGLAAIRLPPENVRQDHSAERLKVANPSLRSPPPASQPGQERFARVAMAEGDAHRVVHIEVQRQVEVVGQLDPGDPTARLPDQQKAPPPAMVRVEQPQ